MGGQYTNGVTARTGADTDPSTDTSPPVPPGIPARTVAAVAQIRRPAVPVPPAALRPTPTAVDDRSHRVHPTHSPTHFLFRPRRRTRPSRRRLATPDPRATCGAPCRTTRRATCRTTRRATCRATAGSEQDIHLRATDGERIRPPSGDHSAPGPLVTSTRLAEPEALPDDSVSLGAARLAGSLVTDPAPPYGNRGGEAERSERRCYGA